MVFRIPINARGLVFLLLGISLFACSLRIDSHGFIPDEELINVLKPGLDTRNTVARVLGSPSAVSTFEDSTWYYISKRTEQLAFFNEKVLDLQILAIHFDEEGNIDDIKRYAMEDGRLIDPVTRTTPTSGRELGFLEQLFGNLGRFNNTGSGNVVDDY